jgi:hypothetical protein
MARPRRLKIEATKAKSDNRQNLRVVDLASYQTPVIKEEYNKGWVSYGEDNDYFQELIERYLGSATNSRCINGIVDMSYGRGLEALDRISHPKEYLEMKTLLNGKQIKRVVHDYKMLGQAAIQVSYNKAKTKILKVSHFPMETLRAEKAGNDGIISAYYYHPKWSDVTNNDEPKRIPTFGNGSKAQRNELYVIKPYRSGFYYYSPVDYNGCLQYCYLESEVSNYHINNIKNGLQPSLFVNFNNGIPSEETQDIIERKIYQKFGGSTNGGKAIIAFNESIEQQASIEAIHLPDAHAQYQFLSDEATQKIMLGHGIVSPILLGIKDNTGFGNNAEELRTAAVLMDNVIIRPIQDEILSGLKEILSFNNINLNIYFTTLQPIEFTELDNISTKIKREEETGEKLSSQELSDFSDEDGDDMLNQLEGLGELISDDWELIHSEELKGSETDLKMAVETDERTWVQKLFNITPSPKKKSVEDNSSYKIRYAYVPSRKSSQSRNFCKHMEVFTDNNIVFRKEDINQMSFRGVNRSHGHKGQNYSLLKYKGGKYCKHLWELRVYRKKGGEVDVDKAFEDGLKRPNNPSETTIKPHDMPNGGAYPTI